MENDEKKDTNLLQSVTNALLLLELFTREEPEIGVSEISRKMKIGRSTAHRLLYTLKEVGFVEQNSRSGRYQLGMKVLTMAQVLLSSLSIRDVARPYLEELQTKVNEAVHLAVFEQNRAVFIDKINAHRSFSMTSVIGWQPPLHCSASGKLLLALQAEEVRNSIIESLSFEAFTARTITNKEELITELTLIRDKGYSVDNEEVEEGLFCMAYPVYNLNNEVKASISVSGPLSRMKTIESDLLFSLRETAQLISNHLY